MSQCNEAIRSHTCCCQALSNFFESAFHAQSVHSLCKRNGELARLKNRNADHTSAYMEETHSSEILASPKIQNAITSHLRRLPNCLNHNGCFFGNIIRWKIANLETIYVRINRADIPKEPKRKMSRKTKTQNRRQNGLEI